MNLNYNSTFAALVLGLILASGDRLPAQGDTGLPSLPKPVIVAEQLAGKLVRLKDDSIIDYKLDPETAVDHFLFYYSGGWNPSCRKFTPALVKFYEEQKAAGAKFEVIFVSKDDSEEEMRKYMVESKMPWPAIRFGEIEGLEFINEAAGRGVPCIAVLDSHGLIMIHSYRRKKEYLGAEKPLAEFAKMLERQAKEGEDKK